MPKFLVTNGSNFQPFTYDELVRPLQEMAQAKRDTQDQYDAISMQAEALRRYISEDGQKDVQARKMYDDYMNKLSTLQENLWNNGYNSGTRRDLSAARAGYFSDIQRLGKAIQTRQESSLKWREAVKNDPSLVTSGDPGLDDLDAYLADDLHGSEWYSYSGNKFTAEVGADAQTRVKELFQNMKDRISVEKDPRMKGYLMTLVTTGATSQQVDKAGELVKAAVAASKIDPSAMNVKFNASTPEGLLANILMNHLNETGAKGKVSDSEFDRLVIKGIEGLSHSIGGTAVDTKQDLEWTYAQQRANEKYKHDLAMDRLQKAAELKGQQQQQQKPKNYSPVIAVQRGHNISARGDSADKSDMLKSLETINELKKTNALKDPSTGKLVKTAEEAMNRLNGNKEYMKLINGDNGFVLKNDLDPIITKLYSEVHDSVANLHNYQFQFTNASVQNILQNTFKTNIGQLSGKKGDSRAGSVAKYDNDDKVSAKELMSILASNNISIGYDPEKGDILLQRNGSDDKTKSTYDDRLIRLDPETVLYGTSAYANADALRYVFDSELPDSMTLAEKDMLKTKLLGQATTGNTVDMRYLSHLIEREYNDMVVNGSPDDMIVYNALVQAFGAGLYYSANTPWSPDNYNQGWAASTGGQNISDDDLFNIALGGE